MGVYRLLKNRDFKSLIWNYISTIIKIFGGFLLMPLIVTQFSSDDVGIWTILMTITSLIGILDMGFIVSFTRNVSYLYNGADEIWREGIMHEVKTSVVNDLELGKLIQAMRMFYKFLSAIVVILMLFGGSIYLLKVLTNYSTDPSDVYFVWLFFIFVNGYNVYTLYLEAILIGTDQIISVKQTSVIGYLIYLFVSISLVLYDLDLLAIVTAQMSMLLYNRWSMKRKLMKIGLSNQLSEFSFSEKIQVLKTISPNSFKIGLTSLGGYLVNRFSLFIGSLYLDLKVVGSLGIMMQIILVLNSICNVYFSTKQYRINQLQILGKKTEIMGLYKRNVLTILFLYGISFVFFIFLRDWLTYSVKGTFVFPSLEVIVIVFVAGLLEINHVTAANYILSSNVVPFFKASLISGISVIIVCYLFLVVMNFGAVSIVLAPAIVQLAYQNWKWPLYLIKNLKSA